MSKLNNAILGIVFIASGSVTVAEGSSANLQSTKTNERIHTSASEVDSICGQNFGGTIIRVNCENIPSILAQHPGFKAGPRVKLPDGGTLHTLRNKDGHVILYIVSALDNKE